MKPRLFFLLVATLLAELSAHAGTPSKFSSVPEMVASFRDYSSTSDTFEVLAESPLHIRLLPIVLPGQPDEVVSQAVKSTLDYGILRSFIHTPIERITVTATPQERALKRGPKRLLESESRTITATRQQTLRALQKFFPGKTFSDLVMTEDIGGTPLPDQRTPIFNRMSFPDQGSPGIDAFLNEFSQ